MRVLCPPSETLREARKRLPTFEPIDLRAVVKNAREQKTTVVAQFQRRSLEQAFSLLQQLGIDRADPEAWRKGFYILATYDRGLGHLAWSPERTNKNATRWTTEHILNLFREVTILTTKGLSERKAVSQLARDRNKRKLFPYRPKRPGLEPKGTELARYEAALWRQLQHLKASASWDMVFGLFEWTERDDLDPFERILRMLDDSHASSHLMKIEDALKTTDS